MISTIEIKSPSKNPNLTYLINFDTLGVYF